MARELALSQLNYGNSIIQKNPGFGRGFSLSACSKMCFSMPSLTLAFGASTFAFEASSNDVASLE
jgi:hypothetical protein